MGFGYGMNKSTMNDIYGKPDPIPPRPRRAPRTTVTPEPAGKTTMPTFPGLPKPPVTRSTARNVKTAEGTGANATRASQQKEKPGAPKETASSNTTKETDKREPSEESVDARDESTNGQPQGDNRVVPMCDNTTPDRTLGDPDVPLSGTEIRATEGPEA